jgi:hypothetical protein
MVVYELNLPATSKIGNLVTILTSKEHTPIAVAAVVTIREYKRGLVFREFVTEVIVENILFVLITESTYEDSSLVTHFAIVNCVDKTLLLVLRNIQQLNETILFPLIREIVIAF